MKDATAESFKSRRCEAITIPHSETAFFCINFLKNDMINSLTSRET